MKTYVTGHKIKALKIVEVSVNVLTGIGTLTPEDKSVAPIEVSAKFVSEEFPKPGGYYVVSIASGEAGYNSADFFEALYTEVPSQDGDDSEEHF